jgi:hypothetical protein
MRQIDWDKKLSDEDIAWIRQAALPLGEERIKANADQFGTEVPDPEVPDDEATRVVVGPDAQTEIPKIDPQTGAPRLVDPADNSGDELEEDEEADDYDSWSKADLETEVAARNDIAAKKENVSEVTVTGTGKDGNVLKDDLIKGLRLWDQENPTALDD